MQEPPVRLDNRDLSTGPLVRPSHTISGVYPRAALNETRNELHTQVCELVEGALFSRQFGVRCGKIAKYAIICYKSQRAPHWKLYSSGCEGSS